MLPSTPGSKVKVRKLYNRGKSIGDIRADAVKQVIPDKVRQTHRNPRAMKLK